MKIDLLFIVDITGSMGGLIKDAQERMIKILNSLKNEYSMNLKTGLSFYRDHPSQDTSFVTATFDLDSTETVQQTINKIEVGGGGDEPEAVLDGIIDGIGNMNWRKGSRRIAFLIGDAPAHGMIGDDCCLCGKTWGNAINIAEKNKVSIYSVILGSSIMAENNFKLISNFTGGILIANQDAMDAILKTLKSEFEDVSLDSKILEMMSKNKDPEEICNLLKIDRNILTESKTRIVQYY